MSSYEPVAQEEGQEVGNVSHDGYPPKRLTVAALSLGLRKHRGKIKAAVAVILLVPLCLWLILAYALPNHPALMPVTLQSARRILLVVAHPDDECLFFSPSVTALLRRGQHQPVGHVLVLSSGNHYGLGDVRRKELQGSCNQLGVATENCIVLNQVDIQDDPVTWWPEERLDSLITEHIRKWEIDLIVTFDSGGVSGHINHRAVSASLVRLAHASALTPPVYLSKTVFVVRKYSGILDLPLSFLPFFFRFFWWPNDKKALLVSDLSMYRAARAAFWSHQSQLVWDRVRLPAPTEPGRFMIACAASLHDHIQVYVLEQARSRDHTVCMSRIPALYFSTHLP